MAEAMVGQAFLSGAVSMLFTRLTSPEFISFVSKPMFNPVLRDELEIVLLSLRAVLDDAEVKQFTNPDVKLWLHMLQHVIYQADDLLDEIATKALKDKVEADHAQSSTSRVGFSRLLRPIDQFWGRTKMESRMKEIITQLEKYANQINHLNLSVNHGRKPSQSLPTTSSLVYESDICGRKDDKEEIINKLLFSGTGSATVNEIPVIPIQGMGGIGKTTLAQSVYNDARVSRNFAITSWVCVSDAFDVTMITKKILAHVDPSNPKLNNNIDDLDQLQPELNKSLAGKTFLIVLDDVWNDNPMDWDALCKPFRSGAQGSRIIVTTRKDSVASMMKPISIHRLQPLPVEDCWALFAKHAFVNGDYMAHPELESIGREIVNKCGRLPLAVKSIGSLLGSKSKIEWEDVLESKIWDSDPNISAALRISYFDLPSHLKQCFAYCSVFPKDYQFEVEELVQLWIALDFVQQPKSGKSVEDKGKDYFDQLLSRSFFQRLSHDNDSHFVMHDLVHDLALDISGDFCCRLDHDQPLVGISENAFHFSYVRGEYDAFQKFKAVNEVKSLRTFMSYSKEDKAYGDSCLGNKVLNDILLVQISLRVLSLSSYHISELPESIENLIHLRYLDVSTTRIKQLPDSVTSLCNLRRLDLSHCWELKKLPVDVGKLINLRRLDMKETGLTEMPAQISKLKELRHLDLSFCRLLTKLPVDMATLINLRHLDIRGTGLTEMPTQMSKLKDLRHLSCFVVGKNSGSSISELKELRHLSGELRVSGLENVVSGQVASEAKMKDKKHVEGLALKWNGDADDSTKENDVLEKLEPPPGVKSVSISNYGGTRFPHWLGRDHSFPNMVSLALISCPNCYLLPSIGQLPSLKHLRIEGMKEITEVGREFYEDASSSSSSIKPFLSLETLRFEEMSEWKEWHALGAGGEFSRLQKLCIVDCPKLSGELPNNFPSLRELEISGCDELVSSQIGLLLQGLPCLQELKMSKMANLTELPPESCRLVGIERMEIAECPRLVSFPDMGLPPTLKALVIRECRSLKFPVPEETDHNYHASIEVLEITNSYDGLESLSFGFFPKLRDLFINGCINFETISIPKEELQNLVRLGIRNCPKMVSFPHGNGNGNDGDAGGLLVAPNLTFLSVRECEKLKSLPQQMHSLLPSLQTLKIKDCPEIESFPEGGLPSTLGRLEIRNCKKLMNGRIGWGLQQQTLPSLTYLLLGGENSEEELESFPEEWLLPTTLTYLTIWEFPNLKSINHKGLQHLTSLQRLDIFDCPKLECLPQEGLPNSLSYLSIHECPKLECLPQEGLPNSLSYLQIENCPMVSARCQREKGQDWPIISPISHIMLDWTEHIVNLE